MKLHPKFSTTYNICAHVAAVIASLGRGIGGKVVRQVGDVVVAPGGKS